MPCHRIFRTNWPRDGRIFWSFRAPESWYYKLYFGQSTWGRCRRLHNRSQRDDRFTTATSEAVFVLQFTSATCCGLRIQGKRSRVLNTCFCVVSELNSLSCTFQGIWYSRQDQFVGQSCCQYCSISVWNASGRIYSSRCRRSSHLSGIPWRCQACINFCRRNDEYELLSLLPGQ